MGLSYGANGVWQWHVPNIVVSHKPQTYILESLDYPGATQLASIKMYFEKIEWWNLVPVTNAVKSNAKLQPTVARLENKMWIYLPKDSQQIQMVRVFESSHTIVEWKNPKDLSTSRKDTVVWSANLEVKLSAPDHNDWLLVASSLDIKPEVNVPEMFTVFPSYPNPFNPSTTISFDLPKPSAVNIDVFTTDGRSVRGAFIKNLGAGTHTHTFDATGLNSGVYLLRVKTDFGTNFTKATFIK
jgi:hypothetical protein